MRRAIAKIIYKCHSESALICSESILLSKRSEIMNILEKKRLVVLLKTPLDQVN